jgi:hypothetical protein
MRIPSSLHVLVIVGAFVSALIGCTSAEVAPVAAFALAKPNVVMAADPQPSFTYWAPDYATILNHPCQPGIWIAESPGGSRKHYFGDSCRLTGGRGDRGLERRGGSAKGNAPDTDRHVDRGRDLVPDAKIAQCINRNIRLSRRTMH